MEKGRDKIISLRLFSGLLLYMIICCGGSMIMVADDFDKDSLSLIGFDDTVMPIYAEDIDDYNRSRMPEDSVIDIMLAPKSRVTIRDKQPERSISRKQELITSAEVTDKGGVVDIESAAIAETEVVTLTKVANLEGVMTDTLSVNSDLLIINGDTVTAILPENIWGRYDRGMKNYMFMPKGKWIFGLSASYGNLDIADFEFLSYLSDLDLSASIVSVYPEVSYAIGNNRVVGMRMSYSEVDFGLDGLDINIMDDIDFSISNVVYNDRSYSASVFYRYYIGLDRAHRFSLFNEVDLTFLSGSGLFGRTYDGEEQMTNTTSAKVSLNYSPGLSVFIQEYVSFNVSFGIFGFYYLNEKQFMESVQTGSRTTNGASFQFNLFNIKFGIAVII